MRNAAMDMRTGKTDTGRKRPQGPADYRREYRATRTDINAASLGMTGRRERIEARAWDRDFLAGIRSEAIGRSIRSTFGGDV